MAARGKQGWNGVGLGIPFGVTMIVPAVIGGLGPWELGIVLVLVLIVFGAGKLPQVFESFGLAVKKFRDAQKDDSIDISPPGQLSEGTGIPEAHEVKDAANAER